jgi:Response regulators consisting of a CheY-like receiver domain and a winged-helix DNA-binding domain
VKIKILIVEDTADDLLIVTRYLKKEGYVDIVSAVNVAGGIQKALDERPDIVISDTLLPDGNGFDVCREIKAKLGGKSPKIIITTGSIDAVDAVKARRVGADDYCGKTSDCAPLLEALKKLVQLMDQKAV